NTAITATSVTCSSVSSSSSWAIPALELRSVSTGGAVLPVISGVTSSGMTATSATITWTTDRPASSQVEFGTTASYGSLSALNSSPITLHSVTLTGLNPNTTYNFAVISAVLAQTATSANFIFSTPASVPVNSSVTASGITTTSATITWATDQPSSSQVGYGTTTAYGSLSTLNPALVTLHSVTLTGLTPGTTYDYAAISGDSAGTATSANFIFSTPSVPLQSTISRVGGAHNNTGLSTTATSLSIAYHSSNSNTV